MGKITSGGLKGIKSVQKLNNTEPIVSQNSPSESYTDYAKRNVAKVPAMAYELGRSGLGLGNLLNFIGERSQQAGQGYLQQYPQAIQQASQGLGNLGQLARRAILPTGQEANQEAQTLASFLPGSTPEGIRYATEHRPEDYPAEFALMELPRIIASAGTGGIPGAAKAVGRSLGLFGGSEAGHAAGGALGELLGDRQVGELAGGLAGGHYGQKLANIAMNRPGKYFPAKVSEIEQNEFESNKTQRIADAEKEYQQKIDAINNEYKSKIKQSKADVSKSKNEFAKDKSKFEKEKNKKLKKLETDLANEQTSFEEQKQNKIKQLEQDKIEYNDKIENLKKESEPHYQKAKELENDATGYAGRIVQVLDEIEADLQKGVPLEDQLAIEKNVSDIRNDIMAGKGIISLNNVKKRQKNLNAQARQDSRRSIFNRETKRLVKGLNEFIEDTGSKKHNAEWQKAEGLWKEASEMAEKRNKSRFVAKKNQDIKNTKAEQFPLNDKAQEIRDTKRESYAPEKEVYYKEKQSQANERLKQEKSEYKNKLDTENKRVKETVNAIGKETFEKLVKSETEQNKLTSSISKLADSNIGKYGISGLAAALGYFTLGKKGAILAGLGTKLSQGIAKEVSIVRNVMNKHPELYNQYAKLISESGNLDKTSLILRANQLGSEVEKLAQQDEFKPKKGITKGGLKFSV